MNLISSNLNKKLIREIAIILVIKIFILLIIKHIWFNQPTIPKNFNNQVAEHIAGNSSQTKETH